MEQQIVDGPDSKTITIQALSRKTRNIISTLLNPIKIIPSDKRLPRDWQGLADLCGISGEKINNLRQHTDPSSKVLDLWYENSKNESTIEKFILFLEDLDRFDVLEDISTLIDEDIRSFKKSQSTYKTQSLNLHNDPEILTVDDAYRLSEGLEPQTYDAFVLFADDDIDFATELINKMEKEYNLKFCVKDRDLVGGGIEHSAVIKLVSERCGRLIAIVSPAFLKSSTLLFFYSFAQAIGIEQRQRKIIPCLYKDRDKYTSLAIPTELAMYHILDYSRSGKLWNFWDKLYNSIRTPKEMTNTSAKNTVLLNKTQVRYNFPLQQQFQSQRSMTDSSALVPIHEVKFNTVDLHSSDNEKVISDETIYCSNSANSLSTNPPKEKKSVYNRLKKIIATKYRNNSKTNEGTDQLNNGEIEKKRKKAAVAN